MGTQRTCSIVDCEKKVFGHGWCNMHYSRWRAHGDPSINLNPRRPSSICLVADCGRPHDALGLCNAHWQQLNRTGAVPTGPVRTRRRDLLVGPCVRPGCSGHSKGSGYCDRHYGRLKMFFRYGMAGWDEYDEMWEACGGRCCICRRELDPEDPMTHVDHAHLGGMRDEAGPRRGILCRGCNNAIGNCLEKPEVLRAAADYLERWAEINA